MKQKRFIQGFTLWLFFALFGISSGAKAFPLLSEKGISLVFDKQEESVVHRVVAMFREDVRMVSGKELQEGNFSHGETIVLGTIGSPYISKLVEAGSLKLSDISGKWEAFQIEVVTYKERQLLAVVGSDKRGTAYGLLELSRLLGVSPWVYWADNVPQKRSRVDLPDDYRNVQQPSVPYRGIFINDEDLGFMPWSTQTVDRTSRKGATGPKAYQKVFELMLRLRANVLWPAMHECTVPFYQVAGNQEMAREYGIIIGTSHTESLMRNSASEWHKETDGAYNYATNKAGLTKYWRERLEEVKNEENFYTMGIRGVHDLEMEGATSLDDKTKLLQQVIDDQRILLHDIVDTAVEKLPQVFVPYKEVLPIYENGLQVPDDVTLMWCDDNYGYLTRLSTAVEQQRQGGAGLYYHLSYLGRPHQYIWLSNTSPALIYWQLRKAWEHQVRKIWVANVGDIKPSEYEIEFFLNLAWDINAVQADNIEQVQEQWLAREFGASFAPVLNRIRKEYDRLNHIRRPEFMGWSRQEEAGYRNGRSPVTDTEFNPYVFGDEIHQRLMAYENIEHLADSVAQLIPQAKADAYYQLILFPVKAAAAMNRKLLFAQKARLYAGYGLPVANEYAVRSGQAFEQIESYVAYYNNDLAGGKWKGMQFRRAWGVPVYERAPLPEAVAASQSQEGLVWPENYVQPFLEAGTYTLKELNDTDNRTTFVSIFSKDGKSPHWELISCPEMLRVQEDNLSLTGEKRLLVEVQGKPFSDKKNAEIVIKVNTKEYVFRIPVYHAPSEWTVESDSLICLPIGSFTGGRKDATVTYKGLGYSRQALELKPGESNKLTYAFETHSTGRAKLVFKFLPNHAVVDKDIRVAVAIDGGTPQVYSLEADFKERDEEWKQNVLRNQAVITFDHLFEKAGKHRLSIFALDEGVLLDQLAVDFKKDRKYYMLPENHNKKL